MSTGSAITLYTDPAPVKAKEAITPTTVNDIIRRSQNKLLSLHATTFTASATVYSNWIPIPVGQTGNITNISVIFNGSGTPAGGGTLTLTAHRWRSAAEVDLLAGALDMKTAVKTIVNPTISATAGNLLVVAGDALYFKLIASGTVTTNTISVDVTITFEDYK
jgi:hypothetical protein